MRKVRKERKERKERNSFVGKNIIPKNIIFYVYINYLVVFGVKLEESMP